MSVQLKGTLHGKRIELEKDLGLPPGTPVTVQVDTPKPVEDFRNVIFDLCGAWKDEPASFFDEILERANRPVREVPPIDAPS